MSTSTELPAGWQPTAETLAAIKPRQDIVIKRHAPFERWDNVIALAHESHP